jgi:hypothetical protein
MQKKKKKGMETKERQEGTLIAFHLLTLTFTESQQTL